MRLDKLKVPIVCFDEERYPQFKQEFLCKQIIYCSNVSATPIGQMGIEMGGFPLGVCLIMKKAPSDSPICQLK